jgi:hypothetical protein
MMGLASAAWADSQAMVATATETTVQATSMALSGTLAPTKLAGLRLCSPASATRPTVIDESLAKLVATPGPAEGAAFDNLLDLGSGSVSVWALDRFDDIVLIDALNTADEVDQLICLAACSGWRGSSACTCCCQTIPPVTTRLRTFPRPRPAGKKAPQVATSSVPR